MYTWQVSACLAFYTSHVVCSLRRRVSFSHRTRHMHTSVCLCPTKVYVCNVSSWQPICNTTQARGRDSICQGTIYTHTHIACALVFIFCISWANFCLPSCKVRCKRNINTYCAQCVVVCVGSWLLMEDLRISCVLWEDSAAGVTKRVKSLVSQWSLPKVFKWNFARTYETLVLSIIIVKILRWLSICRSSCEFVKIYTNDSRVAPNSGRA